MDEWAENATLPETIPSDSKSDNIFADGAGGTRGALSTAQHDYEGSMFTYRQQVGIALLVAGCTCVLAFVVILSIVNWISRQQRIASPHPKVSKNKVVPMPVAEPQPPPSPTRSEMWGMPISPRSNYSALESATASDTSSEEGDAV